MKIMMRYTPRLRLVLLLLLATNISIAQENEMQIVKKRKPDIVLYSITGISFLNYANLQDLMRQDNVNYPDIAMNLGAGYYSTFGRIRLGMDFGSTNASAKNEQYITKHNGSFFSINLGYHVLEKKGFIIAPVLGYSSLRNNILIENKQYSASTLTPFPSNSTSLTNNTNALKLQLSVEKILKNGLFAGLSFGFDYSFVGEQAWKISDQNSANQVTDNMSEFYINLSIGTHLNHKK
jgi:hypothetical protein